MRTRDTFALGAALFRQLVRPVDGGVVIVIEVRICGRLFDRRD